MQEVAAYSTLAMTLSLVVTRPRLGTLWRLSPAVAAFGGVVVMVLFGVVDTGAVGRAASDVWPSFTAIAAIMAMTAVAMSLGVLDWMAARVESGALTTRQLFRRVFVLGIATAAILNNDAAILLLTPLVVSMVRRRYPDQPQVIIPFAFAVFMAAGVAPFVVSNPMNMVVADYAQIGFNEYALRMAPIALAGWLVAYYVLALLFRKQLAAELAPPARREGCSSAHAPMTGGQRAIVALLFSVLLGYSLIGYLGGPVWLVALVGAALALAVAWRERRLNPVQVLRTGVSWETLAFLLAVLILALGLLDVGLGQHLVEHYSQTGPVGVGITSAFGSAVLNNHPMAYLNMLSLDAAGQGHSGYLAALIGGDLGPRLLPMGSLAGLLWLESLRRMSTEIPLATFVRVGVAVTVPALAVSLGLLAIL